MKNVVSVIKNSLNRLKKIEESWRVANMHIKILHNKMLRRVRGETTYSVMMLRKRNILIRVKFLLHILEKKIRKYVASLKNSSIFLN